MKFLPKPLTYRKFPYGQAREFCELESNLTKLTNIEKLLYVEMLLIGISGFDTYTDLNKGLRILNEMANSGDVDAQTLLIEILYAGIEVDNIIILEADKLKAS
jgi:hypothetical protein